MWTGTPRSTGSIPAGLTTKGACVGGSIGFVVQSSVQVCAVTVFPTASGLSDAHAYRPRTGGAG